MEPVLSLDSVVTAKDNCYKNIAYLTKAIENLQNQRRVAQHQYDILDKQELVEHEKVRLQNALNENLTLVETTEHAQGIGGSQINQTTYRYL